MEALLNSLLFFGTSALYGFWIQSIYQCILGLRIVIPGHKLVCWAVDLVFWPAAALMTFQMIFEINSGQIRGYGIFGLLLGMTVSHFTVGSLLNSLSRKIRSRAIRSRLLRWIRKNQNLRKERAKEKAEERAKQKAEEKAFKKNIGNTDMEKEGFQKKKERQKRGRKEWRETAESKRAAVKKRTAKRRG